MILQSDQDAWLAARLGHVTASRVADVIAKTKTGVSAMRATYAAELVVERLMASPGDRYVNAAMQWGLDTEPHARSAYEFRCDVDVSPAAFIKHPSIEWAGASPDGFVGDDGLVEFKCPTTATHIDTLLGTKPPAKYITQMQWQMAVTGRQWCDFVSFDPRLTERMRFFLHRVPRDNAMIADLERQVELFLSEIEDTLSQLRAREYA